MKFLLIAIAFMLCISDIVCKLKGKNEKEHIGVALLDAVTFSKIVPQNSKSVLLLIHNSKTDGDYGSDSIREDFYAFAEKSQLHGSSDSVLFAQVIVSEEEPANMQIALKHGMSPQFVHPQIFLYLGNSNQPIEYPSKHQVNHIALSRWLSKQLDDYFLPGPGLIESFGLLVARFMKLKDKDAQTSIIAEATELSSTVELKDRENAKTYIKIFQRVIDQGPIYVRSEIKRLEDLIAGDKISKTNQILLQRKVNILHSFDRDAVHDEL